MGSGAAGDGLLFARQLQYLRRSASLSQHELAERAGLSIRAISNLESGRALWPHPQTVRRLAEAPGLTGDEHADFVSSAGRRLVGGEAGLPPARPGDRRTQPVARTGVPNQLPGQVRQFIGRGGWRAGLALALARNDGAELPFDLMSRSQDGDLAAGAELADHCGRLPFALRVAAQLAEMRGLTLADLAAQTANPRHRLDVLETGADLRTALRNLFWWSYRGLSPAAALMFRLLCVHPGPDISIQAAADLAELPGASARQVLAELTSAHMLIERLPERFSCHDLLRTRGQPRLRPHRPLRRPVHADG